MAVELVNQGESETDTIRMPAPTPWPIALAFGLALVFAGMVTSEAVSVLGAIVAIAGAVGWFRDVLPYEAHETVEVMPEAAAVTTTRREVVRMAVANELQRAYLPLEIYPISAGVKGGLAGSVAMAVVAMLYGLISQHSIWYPINLLAAGFLPGAMTDTTAKIAAFNLSVFLIATAIHLLTSLLVGLLYGAMLPMLPRRPILLGGFIAPLFWTGLIHSILGIVNPVLNQRIHWLWFVASQVAFGIVAGIVVSQQERIRTWQRLPLSYRSGMEASGMKDESR
jgi:membrane-associated protease RseP (regulator of RpoE activity)